MNDVKENSLKIFFSHHSSKVELEEVQFDMYISIIPEQSQPQQM